MTYQTDNRGHISPLDQALEAVQNMYVDQLDEITERIDEVIGRWPELYGCENLTESHNGKEWTDFSRHDCDSTYHLTYEQTRVWEKQQDNMIESFLHDFKDKLPKNIDKNNYWDLLNEEMQQEFQDYEAEWFEPALLRVTIQDNELFMSINYTDQPYYRYQYDEPMIKITMSETADETLKTMSEAYDKFLKENEPCSKQ